MTDETKKFLSAMIASLLVCGICFGMFWASSAGADKARKQERDAAGQAGVGEYFITKDGVEPIINWRFKPHSPPVIVNEPVQMAPKKAEIVAQRIFDAWGTENGK